MVEIETLRSKNSPERIVITEHARLRLQERRIKVSDIVHCIDIGEIIQQYEDDTPFPSCLILGESTIGRKLHVVVSTDREWIYLITAYYPDPNKWEIDFRTRKEPKQ